MEARLAVAAGAESTLTPEAVAARITELVTLPAVYLEVRRIVQDPDSAVADLATCIGHDPAICARLLRVANSAAYRGVRDVGTVAQAVGVLGMQRVHDLALASSIGSMFASLPPAAVSLAGYWSRAMTTAVCARNLAVAAALHDAERPFVVGLLAECGHLAMFQSAPECVLPVLERCAITDARVIAVERERLGFCHADVGAALLDAWRLPPAMVDSVRRHVDASRDPDVSAEARVVRLAWHVACAMAGGETIAERLAEWATDLPRELGLDDETVTTAGNDAIDEAEALCAQFFPHLAACA